MESTLSPGVGYGLIIGGSAFFAIGMNLITYLINRAGNHNSNNIEEFVSGSRSIGFALLLSTIVSNWTWSITLVVSAIKSFSMGVSGSYWYGIGGLCQVAVFAVISSKIKSNANLVTTFPEMGYLRFGYAGHLAFLFCGLTCNVIVSSSILLSGSAVFQGITSISQYAFLWLIPFGCAIYVSVGGLRATFISDASHTSIILIFILVFMFEVYARNDKIGSAKKMWELLQQAAPIEGNYHGSPLTFRSEQGGIFSIISIITGFGLVVNDQAYFSRAVAADPRITSRAYFFAALCWFVIPLSMGLSLGLAAKALSSNPDFPTFNDIEIGEGLPTVAAAIYLMGKSGAAMMLVMIFFSVASSYSGELIGTSTLLSYDIYKRYIKPDATPKEVLIAAKVSVFLWAIFSSAIASVFYGAASISTGFLFNFTGAATSAAVIPVTLSIGWRSLNKAGAVGGCIGGSLLGLIAWLVSCKGIVGPINVTNLNNQWVSLTGNVVSLVSGAVISITLSLIWPANFDWEKTRNKTSLDSTGTTYIEREKVVKITSGSLDLKPSSLPEKVDGIEIDEKESSDSLEGFAENGIDHKHLNHQFKKYCGLVIILVIIMGIVIPVPLSASPYIFSPGFLLGVVIIAIIWLFCTFFYVVLLPILDSRRYLFGLAKQVLHL
ncbi:unnamed protein product [Candida verbasci]|uniref:Urea transporter n=1 Tax=Candida verbasci TaxID=1227364 RepID=A0A9W4TTK0_9ASCO|nr:unnamed protein product [Candida verbasci]